MEKSTGIEAAGNGTLTASEATTGIVGWLATRNAVTTLGGNNATAGLQILVDAFNEANNLPKVREDWGQSLKSPPETLSDIQAVNPIDTLRNILRESPDYCQVWHHAIAALVFAAIPEDSVLTKTNPTQFANTVANDFLYQFFNIKAELTRPELVNVGTKP